MKRKIYWGLHASPRAVPSVAAGILLFVSTLAQGADPSWDTVVAAAKKEGRVFLYGATPVPVIKRVKEGFEKLYPDITLEYYRQGSAAVIIKANQDRATGADGADVLISTEIGWAVARANEGSAKTPIGPDAKQYPSKYMIAGKIPALAMEPITIAYNTKVVKDPPAGYPDLLKPQYKGRVGLLDIKASTTVVAFYDWLTRTYGADYLPNLAKNKPFVYGSAPVSAQSVAAGEYEIASFVNTSSGKPMVDKGAPFKMVIPNPAFGFRYVGAILGWAKRPNAAQVFMNYVMSRDGQIAWSGSGDSASPLPNIPGSLNAETIEPYDASPYTKDVSNAKIAAWNKVFKK